MMIGRGPLRGEAGRQALEAVSEFKEIDQIDGCRLGNEKSTARDTSDQLVLNQPLQGLPDGSPAHAQPLDDNAFFDRFAGLELCMNDHPPEFFIGAIILPATDGSLLRIDHGHIFH